jgi:hypothetical protein
MKKRVWLISGGTCNGAILPYALRKALIEQGPPDVICGVSIGAVTAALIGQVRVEDLIAIWREVDGTKFFQRMQLDIWDGLFSLEPLRKRIEHEVAKGTWEVPTFVGVTDLDHGTYRNVRIDTLTPEKAAAYVVASAAQPMIHEAQIVDNCALVDGGVLHVLPTWEGLVPSLVPGDEVHAFFASPIVHRSEVRQPRHIPAIGERCAELWIDRTVAGDVQRLHALSESGVGVTVYAHPNPGRPFDASPEAIAHRLDVLGPQVWENRTRL